MTNQNQTNGKQVVVDNHQDEMQELISRQAAKLKQQLTARIEGTLARMAPALFFLFIVQGIDGPRKAVQSFRQTKGAFLALGIASFFGTFLGVLLLSIGTKYAKAGVVAAITSTFPLWVIPISRIFLKEKTNWQSVVCTFLAVAGICYMCLSKLLYE